MSRERADRRPAAPHHPAAPQHTAAPYLFTAAEMRDAEAAAFAAGTADARVVLESAGRAVAAALSSIYPEGRVVALCGHGNNGRDAAVAARTLHACGREVLLVPATDAGVPDDVLHGWDVPVAGLEALAGPGVLIDGILGTGATGPLRGELLPVVEAVTASRAPVVAVDAPTGVDMTTGAVEGPAVRADVTVTFGGLKRGHLLHPGREYGGRVLLAEVGFPPFARSASGARVVTNGWAARHLPRIPLDAHKGRAGIVAVVAGRTGMGGAAIMAAMGALRAGAGGVRVASTESNRVAVQSAVPEAIFFDRDADDSVAEVGAAAAVLVGPGIGTDAAAARLLENVLAATTAPLLLDADALTLIASGVVEMPPAGAREVLLTPHPGELARLLGVGIREVLQDRFAAASEAAARYGAAVLAKGAPSLVARAGEPTLLAVTGHSGVATGGMGDTLGGIAAAFLALGVRAQMAGALALHHAGRAAEVAGRGRGLLPRDVAESLPYVLSGMASLPPPPGHPFILDLPAPR